MIDVYPSRKPRAIYTEIDGKPVELCSQSKEIMRVYVNPEKEGFDEWEKPPGCGTRIYVRMSSPDMDPQQNDDNQPARQKTIGKKTLLGKGENLLEAVQPLKGP